MARFGPLLILLPWGLGLALFFNGISPVWPWLIASCAVCAWWNPMAAAAFASAVLVEQVVKANVQDHLWVYYAATYAVLGLVSLAFFDKVIVPLMAFLVAITYITSYIDLTEGVFYLGLILAAYLGFSGGIFSGLRGFADRRASRFYPDRLGLFRGYSQHRVLGNQGENQGSLGLHPMAHRQVLRRPKWMS